MKPDFIKLNKCIDKWLSEILECIGSLKKQRKTVLESLKKGDPLNTLRSSIKYATMCLLIHKVKILQETQLEFKTRIVSKTGQTAVAEITLKARPKIHIPWWNIIRRIKRHILFHL